MYIEENDWKMVGPFASVSYGECFLWNNDLYMKLGASQTTYGFNAVKLSTGILWKFVDSSKVVPVHAVLSYRYNDEED